MDEDGVLLVESVDNLLRIVASQYPRHAPPEERRGNCDLTLARSVMES